MSYPYPQQGGGMPGYPPQQQQQPGMGFNQPGGQPGGLGFEQGGGGYPPSSGGPGYPPSSGGGMPGYPPQGGGYPPQPQSGGYPGAGYPPQSGYPPQGGAYPQSQPGGYPPAQQPQGGYPQHGGGAGYPPQQQSQGGGYPSQQGGGYPPQQNQPPPRPHQQPQYPQGGAQPGYGAPQGGGYPGATGGQPYGPGQGVYGNQPQSGGYPQQGSGYPQQGGGGYPQQGGYGAQFAGQPGNQGGMATQNFQYRSPVQGTCKAAAGFNPNMDAEVIKKAMKGFGCDEKSIINVLTFRSNAQRQQIRMMFKTMYGKDILKELISELRGNLEELMVALLYTPPEYDAHQMRDAMAGAGTKESVLIEIMCSRTNSEINALKEAYKRLYHRDLEKDLSSETSYHFKRLMVSMSVGGRDESQHTDPARAAQDAQALYKAGEKKMGTDESMFNAIMASQNYSQLQLVFQEYQKISGHEIEKGIQKEFSGDLEDGLLAVVQCIKNRPAFFAERLYKSMKGMGTNDTQLIRCTVTRCEIDMVQIKQEFQKKYGKTLESFIADDTSGKYKDAILNLVRGS